MKEIIKKYLSEESVNGVKVTEKTQKDSKKHNKGYYKEVSKKMADYTKASESEDPKAIKPIKRELTDKESDYANKYEYAGGMEDLEYENEGTGSGEFFDKFKKRQEMAIAGDSKMGNKTYTGEENGNTEPVWGASSEDFGKKLVDKIKKKKKERDEAKLGITSFGDDIEISDKVKPKKKAVSVENKTSDSPVISEAKIKKEDVPNLDEDTLYKVAMNLANKMIFGKIGMTWDDLSDTNSLWDYVGVGMSADELIEAVKDAVSDRLSGEEMGFNESKQINNNIENKPKMKRLKFKKPFNGMDKALSLIPESYKENDKIFEMTDGVESYKVKWDGDSKSGEPVVLLAKNKEKINEEKDKMKHLFEYKSSDTLGSLSMKEKLNENDTFFDMMKKVKTKTNEKDTEKKQ